MKLLITAIVIAPLALAAALPAVEEFVRQQISGSTVHIAPVGRFEHLSFDV